MFDNNSLRRWVTWCGRLALVAASGCATGTSNTRPGLTPLTPPAGSIARQGNTAIDTPQNPVRGKARGTSVSATRPRAQKPGPTVPGRTSGTYVSARAPATDPRLQQQVIQFTRRPNDLIEPPVPVRKWQFIVLHHSGEQNGGYESIDRFHRGPERGWDECGYHFVIGNGSESGDGEIEIGTRWLKQKHGAHTHPPGHTEYNDEGLGICLVGDCNQSPPTPRQVEACRRLVAYLQARCGVSSSGVITHGDAENANTDCPGRYFPYDRLVPRSGFASR